MRHFALLVVIAASAVAVQAATSSTTYVVGTCLPQLPSYSTISEAVGGVSAGSMVLVCPGTYPEQPIITQPLTLQGITVGNSGAAVIVPPSSGMVQTGSSNELGILCAQLTIQSTGPTNINQIVVDGSGNGSPHCAVVGMYYLSASGTANLVQVRNQRNPNYFGVGILTESDGTPQTVNIENSSIQNFDFDGVYDDDLTQTLALNLTRNSIMSPNVAQQAIRYNGGTGNVAKNFVSVPGTAILLQRSSGASPITGNTVVGGSCAICSVTTTTITSNRLLNNGTGISVGPNSTIHLNQITNAGTGIDLACSPATVGGNRIIGATTGIANVPPGMSTPGTFISTTALRTDCP